MKISWIRFVTGNFSGYVIINGYPEKIGEKDIIAERKRRTYPELILLIQRIRIFVKLCVKPKK